MKNPRMQVLHSFIDTWVLLPQPAAHSHDVDDTHVPWSQSHAERRNKNVSSVRVVKVKELSISYRSFAMWFQCRRQSPGGHHRSGYSPLHTLDSWGQSSTLHKRRRRRPPSPFRRHMC